MARAPHQLPPTLRRISRTTTGPSMSRAPTPAPPASPAMARAVGRPCSCPAPAVSLSRLFREVAHRKKAVSPKKKYPRPTLVAAIRRRPYLDGRLLEAKLARGCGNPAFLASTRSASIHAHWRLCITASASLRRA
ncbi:ribonuclease III domain-containing protein RNC1, chloroplastic isoform X1 [Triticum aestivum]|uniref:ribonuclease III domain-containing protein RNC1, chloroplastic isoform X1 n=1 Tax=Triticum aestivum TaxID=4565 RepID=UPI00098BC2BF|nr:ribonuclease III domain-containing protein RNC1, chloroplastic isoform X1 [Aegilops tauschii subsp. strangulata]XP_044355620.1 ribonuclease III domain-containing protein RNC1, chloroplastic-like isoform X1 [Triticum aestivum]